MSSVNIISLNQVVDLFENFSERHYFLNDFGFGPTSEIGTSRQMDFPYMWVSLNENSVINPQNRTAIPELSFSVLFMDKTNIQSNYLNINGNNSDNVQEILSDMLQVLQDFITEVQVDWGNYGIIFQDTISCFPATDETQDKVNGWVGQFSFKLKHSNCILPTGDIAQTNLSPINPMTRYLTCDTVTGCTTLQQYIAQQVSGNTGTSITGFTYQDNTFTISDDNGGVFSTTINTMTGLTVNGDISGTTFYGDGSNLTGIISTDTYVTGGTYNNSTGTATFTNNSGGTFNVTNFFTGYTFIDENTTTPYFDIIIPSGFETSSFNITPSNITIENNDAATLENSQIYLDNGTIQFICDDGTNTNTIEINPFGIIGVPYVVSGVYNNSTGTATLTTATGTQIPITGFTTGSTNTFVTGFTNNNNVFTISDNGGQSYSTTLNTLTGLTINGNLDVTTIDEVDTIDFNLTATTTDATGRLKWNDTDGTLDLGLKGGDVTLQIGQEEVIRVVNKTGSNLLESEYKVVRIRTQAEGGAAGQRLAVLLAQADTKPNHSGILGVVTENINNNQEGFITSFGTVRKINTTGSLQGETWLDGDDLWLSDTVAGGLTNIEPTTHPVRIGYVLYSHAVNGKIFVSLDNGVDELGELHDVTITSPIGGDTLQYNSTLSIWENSNPFFTIDLMDNSSVEFYTVQDTKINTITNVVGSPTITITDDGAPYTLTNTILTGSKITVTSDIPSVIKLNIEY